MIVKTRIFELSNGNYKNLSELAKAMGVSVSQVYRVRGGERQVNQKFIAGAVRAFPGYKLDDLFYLTHEVPTVGKLAAKETEHKSGRLASAGSKPSPPGQCPLSNPAG